jgi:hypothetical protein
MMKWITITVLASAVAAQQKPLAPGCPAVATRPSGSKPKNCPKADTLPPTKGMLKDNECTVAGIMGVCFIFPFCVTTPKYLGNDDICIMRSHC